jgi:transposase InsO family protein
VNKNDQRRKVLGEDVALARYAVISPLICRAMSADEHAAEVQRLCTVLHRFPDGLRRVSKRNVRRWCGYYRHGRPPEYLQGLDALLPRVRGDLGHARKMDPAIIERAIELREEAPSRKTTRLIELIVSEARRRNETPPRISESTLNFHLRARGATRKRLRAKDRVFRRFQHPYRNSCWQGDWSNGLWLPHPSKPGKMLQCFLHGFIDDRTRYVPHAEFYFRQNLPCLEDCMRKAVLKSGVPEMTYVDNGPCYQARQFKLMTARLGTRLVFATEFCPEGKGKIERWIQTVQEDFMDEAQHSGAQTLAELNAFFWAWLDNVYHARKHSTTGFTPRQLWEDQAERARTIAPERLVDIFLWEEERTVDKSGTFQLGGNRYPVSEHLVRERVQVRFDPFDLASARVYHNGVFVEVASPEKLASQTHNKAVRRRTEKALPLESARAFRRQLSGEYQNRVAETLAGLPGDSEGSGFLSLQSFLELLRTALSRHELRPHEKNLAFEFFQRYAPIVQATAEQALASIIAEKGNLLHLRPYLRKIQEAGAAARGGQ